MWSNHWQLVLATLAFATERTCSTLSAAGYRLLLCGVFLRDSRLLETRGCILCSSVLGNPYHSPIQRSVSVTTKKMSNRWGDMMTSTQKRKPYTEPT